MWVVFNLFLLSMLALDLGVLRRKSHEVGMKEALGWSAFWIFLALAFCGGVWHYEGKQLAVEFLTGYLVEYSLSVDNIFVFLLVFTYFKVPNALRHKVLFWGIIGALIMRAILIYAGVRLIERFDWIIVIFGIFLVFTGLKMLFQKETDLDPSDNPLVKWFKRIMPVSPQYHGADFFTHIDGVRHATPLFIVLIVIETTDLIFATDSIPAILGISRDPFIVYTSNAFAILGLRSLYFALAGIMDLFHYLKYALSIILSFVGVKMLVNYWHHQNESIPKIETVYALGFIVLALTLAVVASLIWPKKEEAIEEALRMAEDDEFQPVVESLLPEAGDAASDAAIAEHATEKPTDPPRL